MTDTQKVRWGIVGATAQIAQKGIIPAILSSPHAELTAVASRSRDSAKEIAAAAGPDVMAYGDYDSLIADDAVDVVYLPLPNSPASRLGGGSDEQRQARFVRKAAGAERLRG